MRISDLAKMLNLSSKELLSELEKLRPELVAKGHPVPDSPKSSNRLEDGTVCEVLAIFDRRRLDEKKSKEEEEQRLKQQEQEAVLREEQERLRREEELRHRLEEEQRRLADQELKRKQQEMAAREKAPEPVVAAPVAAPSIAAAAETAVPPPASSVASAAPSRPAAPAAPSVPTDRPARGRQVGNAPPARQDSARPDRGDREKAPGRGAPEKPKEKTKGGDKDKLVIRQIPVMQDEFEGRGRKRRERPRTALEEEAARKRRPIKAVDTDAAKKFRPTRLFGVDDVPRKPASRLTGPGARRKDSGGRRPSHQGPATPRPSEPKVARFMGDFTLGDFAERTGISLADLMRQLLMMGEAITINQMLDPDLAEMLAAEHGVRVEVIREGDAIDISDYMQPDAPETRLPRPPVVTVMGHVDHGKTTLLDAIRKTNVVDQEHGGITQHIGAYTVTTPKGVVTFLDTPGHEAFTAMRARGATMTDIVILVVAANDGIMPQTVEAINHAKAAGVPIIVAINKVDVQGSNPMRVRQELMGHELVSEDLGGSTIVAEVSAKSGAGIEPLLDLVLLQAEIQELKANPNRSAVGTVVESHVDPQRGPVATLLVQRGTLRVGETVLAGAEFGRIRAMYDDKGKPLQEAGPSTPVEVLGMNDAPPAGEVFVTVKDEAAAREIAERRESRRRRRGFAQRAAVTLESLSQHIEEGKVKDLHLVLKADVQGSLEAVSASIQKLPSTKVRPVIIHAGIGNVSASDIDLASASEAVIIGFNVAVDVQARDLAEQNRVEIKTYRIIYDLLDELRRAMLGLLDKKYQEVSQGRARVLQVFRSSKFGAVAGCIVESGTLVRGHKARVLRKDKEVHLSEILSLRRVKDDVKQVSAGTECGIGVAGFDDVEAGDEIATFTLEELAPEL